MALIANRVPQLIEEKFEVELATVYGGDHVYFSKVPLQLGDTLFVSRCTDIGFCVDVPEVPRPIHTVMRYVSLNPHTPSQVEIVYGAPDAATMWLDQSDESRLFISAGDDCIIHIAGDSEQTLFIVADHVENSYADRVRSIHKFRWDVPLHNLTFAYRAQRPSPMFFTRYTTPHSLEELSLIKLANTHFNKTLHLPRLPLFINPSLLISHFINCRFLGAIERDLALHFTPPESVLSPVRVCGTSHTFTSDFLFNSTHTYLEHNPGHIHPSQIEPLFAPSPSVHSDNTFSDNTFSESDYTDHPLFLPSSELDF
jgi:hypothetical protein